MKAMKKGYFLDILSNGGENKKLPRHIMSAITLEHFIETVHIIDLYAKQHNLHCWLDYRHGTELHVYLQEECNFSNERVEQLSVTDYETLKAYGKHFNGYHARCNIMPEHGWNKEQWNSHNADIAQCMIEMPDEIRNDFYEQWTQGGCFNWVEVWEANKHNKDWFAQGSGWEKLLHSLRPQNWLSFWVMHLLEMEGWFESNPDMAGIVVDRLLAYLPTKKLTGEESDASSQMLYRVLNDYPQTLNKYASSFPLLQQMLEPQEPLFSEQSCVTHCVTIERQHLYLYFKQHGLLYGQHLDVAQSTLQWMSTQLQEHGLEKVDIIKEQNNKLRAYFSFNQATQLNQASLIDICLHIMDNFFTQPEWAIENNERLLSSFNQDVVSLNQELLSQVAKASLASWFLENKLEQKNESYSKARKI